jgi:hypothetical protein
MSAVTNLSRAALAPAAFVGSSSRSPFLCAYRGNALLSENEYVTHWIDEVAVKRRGMNSGILDAKALTKSGSKRFAPYFHELTH